jgi:hypothetical protein
MEAIVETIGECLKRSKQDYIRLLSTNWAGSELQGIQDPSQMIEDA